MRRSFALRARFFPYIYTSAAASARDTWPLVRAMYLDYPGDEDRRRFAELVARGEVEAKRGPGSAIAVHGHRADQRDGLHKTWDWTLGCVALDNGEIDEVASLAPVGTRVVIEP